MIELILLGAGIAVLAWNIPVVSAPFRYSGSPAEVFSDTRQGWEQPTADAQKRRNPVVVRAQGNAYNDAPLKDVSRNANNALYTDEFRTKYMNMLQHNRLRPTNNDLEKHWRGTSSHMQGTTGNGYYGSAQAHSVRDQTLPYDFRSDFVPTRFAGALSPYMH